MRLFSFNDFLFILAATRWTIVLSLLSFALGGLLGGVWRGCIQAIPKEQWEASRALALGYLHQLFLVIMPQAVRIAIPPTVGFLVQLVKATAVASIIGFVELTRAGQLMT